MRLLEVGMGSCGRYWARSMIPLVPQVELVGCVDLDPAALALARDEIGLSANRCFSSLDAALKATEPDAVLVATTLAGHVPVATAALECGRHVLTEKPFAPTLAEARALVELAEARGLVLMVSQNYRFFPAPRAAAELVRERRLGELHSVEIDFRHAPTAAAGGHRLLDQPLLIDMAIHHLDLLRLVAGRDAELVSCHAWNPPWSGFEGPPAAVATLLMPGVMASYRGSWLTTGPDTPWAGHWRLGFEQGDAWWTSRKGIASADGDRLVVRPTHGEPAELALPAPRLIDRAGALAEFLDAVRAGREPESSGRDNLHSLAVALAAVESAASGRPVGVRPPSR